MLYRAIGLMSGSSMDGLDIVCAAFQETGGKWGFEIIAADCIPYDEEWTARLRGATTLNALDYQLLHIEYGHYLGQQVNEFIKVNGLDFRVALISSHGHTTFHLPARKLTAQLGDGAAIAALTQLPVVTDLRALDVAFGGQGAPIVPIGDQLLFPEYDFYLNIGGIANISVKKENNLTAFDVCPANRVLNMLSADAGREYDDGGMMASSGSVNTALLDELNALDYYKQAGPKSLANDFGTDVVYPLIKKYGISEYDALATYVEHIAVQVSAALSSSAGEIMHGKSSAGKTSPVIAGTAPGNNAPMQQQTAVEKKLLVTGGGAFNTFLVESLTRKLSGAGIVPVVPEQVIVKHKEALIMGLIGVLRWREETNVLSSVTGARRDSVGGAFWMGQEG